MKFCEYQPWAGIHKATYERLTIIIGIEGPLNVGNKTFFSLSCGLRHTYLENDRKISAGSFLELKPWILTLLFNFINLILF